MSLTGLLFILCFFISTSLNAQKTFNLGGTCQRRSYVNNEGKKNNNPYNEIHNKELARINRIAINKLAIIVSVPFEVNWNFEKSIEYQFNELTMIELQAHEILTIYKITNNPFAKKNTNYKKS